jgi:uncharacterized protein involved in outer membrane biogenesis
LKAVEITMKLKRTAPVVAALLVLLIIVPFLIPMGAYIKQIEQVASETIGQPVTVGSLRLALLPTPRVNVGDLRVGRHDDVTVDNIAVVPELGSLFSEVKVISSVVVKHPVVKKSALDFISAMPKSKSAGGPAKVLIRRLVVSDAQLEWEGMKIPALNAEATLAEGNNLQSASLASTDGKFKVDATAKGEGYGIKLEAHQWIPPAGPPLLFDSLNSDMSLQGSRLNISALDAKMYHGALNATAVLDWGKGWRSSGKFKTQGIEVGEVAGLFSKSKPVSGRLSGDGTFSANAKEPAALANQLVLDYKFNVANGVLHGVDLAKAATLLLTAGEKGGETKFDEMTGTLHIAGKQIELKTFKVVSGLLAASGGIKVSPAKQLDGKVEVELKKGVALVAVPLQVSGTLDNPSVLPTKAALAGAVAGTAVLGPGLGTSLGVKAGSGVDKIKGLFGGGK